jgi:hypothetical protein
MWRPTIEDVKASIVNIASPSIMEKKELIAKRLRPSPLTEPQSVPASNVSTFEFLPRLKGMALTPLPTLSWSFSSKFNLNASSVRMVEEKQHTSVWPKCIVASYIYSFVKAGTFILEVNSRRSL